MTDDRLDLTLAYAADSLDEAERQAVRERLAAGDPPLAGALAEAREVMAVLGGTVPPVAPASDVRRRMLDGLPDRTRRASPAGHGADAPQPRAGSRSPVGPRLATDLRMATSGPAADLRPAARPAWPRLAAAAAVGALLVGGPAAYVARQAEGQRAAQADTAAALERRAVEAEGHGRQLLEKIGSAEVKFAAMNDPAAGPSRPKGRVMWDADGRQCHVWVFDLAPPPPGKVLQLWFLPDGGKPIPAPTFMVDARGRGELLVSLPPGVTKANAAVSMEPAGGSTTPTTVLLVGNL